MIKHIVMWKLLDHAEGNDKATNAQIAKEKLEALNGVIPGLIKLEVGKNFAQSDFAYDLILYSELESKEALQEYHQHPAHKEAGKFIVAINDEFRMVDFET